MIQSSPDANPTPERTSAMPTVADFAQQRIRECPYPALRHVKCRFHEGVLVLTGVVPTFYMKQMAQTVLSRLEQVESLDNRLTVASQKGAKSPEKGAKFAGVPPRRSRTQKHGSS